MSTPQMPPMDMDPTAPAITPVEDAAPANPRITVEMPPDGPGSIGWWQQQLERDKKVREKLLPTWKQNLRRYKGQRPTLTGIPGNETINVNVDFANTEAKKAQLFYQTPELQLSARRPADVRAQPLAQSVANSFLNEVNAYATVDEVLMDVICPAGIGATKIGYQAYMGEPIQQPKMANQPVRDAAGNPTIGPDGQMVMQPQPVLDAMGQPVIESIPNILREEWYWRRTSPAKLYVPANFDQSDYDQAPYLAIDHYVPISAGDVEFGIQPAASNRVNSDEDRLSDDVDTKSAEDTLHCVEIWYRSNTTRPDVADPERFTQLVMLIGRGNARHGGEVLVHRDSPYQELDDRGRFVRGMRGNPIHPLTIRYTSDSAWPNSDCTVSRAAVDELSLGRSQMMRQRRRNIALRAIDVSRDGAAKETAERLEKGTEQSVIPLNGNPNEILAVIAPANMPVENFKFNEIVERDIARLWALGANQNGAPTDANSATEAEIMQRNTDTRLAKERGRVMAWYVKGAEKLFSLLQMFADETQYVEVLSPKGAAELQAWNKQQIGGVFRFTARPDSSIRIDGAQMRELMLRFYNLFANDPNVNRMELDRLVMALFPGLDPSRILNQQPPQPPPDKPKISLSMKMEDFFGPAAPTAYQILQDAGIIIDDASKTATGMLGAMDDAQQRQSELVKHPQSAPAQQMKHPGAATEVETIDQHAADRTGKRPGAPTLAPGAIQ